VSIARRLRRLEQAVNDRCPECRGPWRPGDPVKYVIDWEGGEAADPLPPCGSCGRERAIYIDWPDLPRQTPEEYARMEAEHKAMLAQRWARCEPGGG
jgi:hypothetical protein